MGIISWWGKTSSNRACPKQLTGRLEQPQGTREASEAPQRQGTPSKWLLWWIPVGKILKPVFHSALEGNKGEETGETWWIQENKTKGSWEILKGAHQTELLVCPIVAAAAMGKCNLKLRAEEFGNEPWLFREKIFSACDHLVHNASWAHIRCVTSI